MKRSQNDSTFNTPIKIEQEDDYEDEQSNDGTEQEARPKRLRATTSKSSEPTGESPRKIRRSITPSILDGPFDKCVLNLGENCKSTVRIGRRISTTEACCSSCFMRVFRGKDYETQFVEWKQKASDGHHLLKSDQYVKRYINSKFLPFYKKCQSCGKYEMDPELKDLTAEDFANFKCTNGCEISTELEFVKQIKDDPQWYAKNPGFPPLLQNNVAYSLLVDNYVTRTAGMDASVQTDAKLIDDGGVPFRDTRKLMNMFYVPFTDVIANIVHPEFMEADEKLAFPKFTECDSISIYYLQVRNTIIAMWLKHPFVQVTKQMVEAQIIVRGHARIYLLEHLVEPVLEFLTIKGVINYGAIDYRINPVKNDVKVAIIGAGISGMSAACHLKHLGIDSVIFEAKSQYGGRMNDDKSLGVPVGRGAQIIVGNVNNPITLLCEQLGVEYRNSNFFCPLIDESNGKCYSSKDRHLDDQVDLHYNNVLDAIRNKFLLDKGTPDQSLQTMFNTMSKNLLEAAGLEKLDTPEFAKLIDFHLGNLEFSCGAKVEELSAKEYDHNEKFGNFAGEHAVIVDGAQTLVDHLSKGLDIRLNSVVELIDYSGPSIIIHFAGQEKSLDVDKLIVTTSLAVLKKNPKMFYPPLPDWKQKAIDDLGAGLIEKVAVKFTERFWASLDGKEAKTEYFGKVPIKSEDRSLFNIFYDFSGKNEKNEECYVLMSYVTAEHSSMVNEMTDKQVADKFVEVLKRMFPKKNIKPLGHMVSHWGKDPFIGMSYTFVPFGKPGDESYNQLKESVNDRLFFAGEHTIASEPQTMTGAYLSGLREGGKVVLSLESNFKRKKR